MRRVGGRWPDGAHLLVRGVLRYGNRGSAMVRRKAWPGVERERYLCGGRIERGPGFCDQPSVRRELVDEPWIRALLGHYVDVEATRRRIQERAEATLVAARAALAQAEREEAKAVAAIGCAEREYADGQITSEQWSDWMNDSGASTWPLSRPYEAPRGTLRSLRRARL